LPQRPALIESIDEVIDVAAREGIDAGIVKGGTLDIARNRAQASRLAVSFEEERRWQVDGMRGLYIAYGLADRHEAGGRATTSPIARIADAITGKP
jgi:hypothetical protein